MDREPRPPSDLQGAERTGSSYGPGKVSGHFPLIHQRFPFRKTNIVEHMFKMMEKHSSRLEEKVKIRMNELENEKRKKEVLINRMLPP